MAEEIDELTLTAFALGELDCDEHAGERAAIEVLLAKDAAARGHVQDIRATASLISAELAAETAPELTEIQHAAIERQLHGADAATIPLRPARRNWALWGSLAASVVIVCTVMASVLPKIYQLGLDGHRRNTGNAPTGSGPYITDNPDTPGVKPPASDGGFLQADAAVFPNAAVPVSRGEIGFARAGDSPLCAVPTTTSYPDDACRRALAEFSRRLADHQLPPADQVRTDELVNALPYHYTVPTGDALIAASIDVAGCPWDERHRLLRVGLRASQAEAADARTDAADAGTLARADAGTRGRGDAVNVGQEAAGNSTTLPASPRPRVPASAASVPASARASVPASARASVSGLTVQVEFNPVVAGAYRLIGYETGAGSFRDTSPDAPGFLPAGRSVTALFEVIPAGTVGPSAPLAPLKYQKLTPVAETSRELATVSIRYRDAGHAHAPTRLIEIPVTDAGQSFASAGADFRAAAAAAAFGLTLRDSSYKGNATYDMVIDILTHADPGAEVQEFLDLVKKAKAIAGP